jgi:DNA polymerase III alpha subunit
MAPVAVTNREKGIWEKELLGVSFSEKPFSPIFSGENANAIFCGQIDAELDKVIITAGRVISARFSFTKKNETFVIAIVEDVSGQVQVIAWPQVYAQTEEFWREGNELVVKGRVRAREDEVSVICDNVRFYEPPQEKETIAAGGPPALSEPAVVEAALSRVPAVAVTAAPPKPSRRVVITIRQTSDEGGDIALLNRIIAAIKDFPGQDEVQLNIANGGEVIPLRLSNVQAGYCPELKSRLAELVGKDGVRLEAG